MNFRSHVMSKTRLRRSDPEKERFWREMVQGQQQSGQSVREYCRCAGVKESAFYWWRRELARRSETRKVARSGPVRGRIPDEIEREEVIHDLTDAEKAALGGVENLAELPSETSEQLDWRPSTLFVTVHVRKKYARKEQLPESGLTLSEQNVVVAKKPPEAIPGGLAGPGLMAQVIVSKGADHLPLYRLEGIFKRQGVRISRQTMDGWWLKTAEFLRPLHALAAQVVLASHVIHTDDTR